MTLLLALFLQIAYPQPPPPPVLFTVVQDVQETDGPNPHPLPMHGAYEHAHGWMCWKLDTDEAIKRVQCACKMPCENGGVEDHSCQTSCAGAKCACHHDEACDAPDVQPSQKR